MLLAIGAIWGGGFGAFNLVARQAIEAPGLADGIVVLTGGADRVETGLRMLAEGRAALLLVSGVGRGTELSDLARHVPLSAGQAGSITLGRSAASTVGNAAEAAAWAQTHGLRSLFVVTAGYHMPRALIEIGRALPGVALYPVSVQPPALRRGMDLATVRMMANEYDKYLAVRLGLTRVGDGS